MMKNKKFIDAMFLVQIILLVFLVMFFIISLYVPELKFIYQMLLFLILAVIGYNGSKNNPKALTYLYYIASLFALISGILELVHVR